MAQRLNYVAPTKNNMPYKLAISIISCISYQRFWALLKMSFQI